MKKFISLLLVVGALTFVGCEKSDEDKVKDAAEDAKEKVEGAVEGLK